MAEDEDLGSPPGPIVAPRPVLPSLSPPGLPWIDTSDRAAVAAAYLAVVGAPPPAPAWNGDVATCRAGALADAYRAAEMNRVAWFRGMAGVVDTVVEDAGFTAQAQQAALMMAANSALNHDPPPTWACFTTAGHDGAAHSDLYLGSAGLDAVDAWMRDSGAGNAAVGHRAWIVEPTQVRMGVGAIPGRSAALQVIDPANLFPPLPVPTREVPGFVSWPPRGFVPSTAIYPRWSLHNNLADFSAAAVRVTVNGAAVPTTVEYRGSGTSSRPGPSITFTPTLPAFPAQADLTVNVTVSGITGAGLPSSFSWDTTAIPPPTGARHAPADFDGNGTSDIAVFRPSNGHWFVRGGATTPWGQSGDVPVPGDYDGNGTTDLAVFRPSNGMWFVKGGVSAAWGQAGDVPVPGDFDGNGTTDMAVFRPSNGMWFVKGGVSAAWGQSGDVPVPGDYDGNGTTDLAVFRPSNGMWFVRGGVSAAWGQSGDVPVPGDYDGNGTTDLAVFRPSNGMWFVRGGVSAAWGQSGDVPL